MWVRIIKKKNTKKKKNRLTPMPSDLFPLSIRPDSIVQLQGETRLCLTDNKNLKGKKKNIQIIRSPGIA